MENKEGNNSIIPSGFKSQGDCSIKVPTRVKLLCLKLVDYKTIGPGERIDALMELILMADKNPKIREMYSPFVKTFR